MFMHSPSDVFGSLISDTEGFLDDLQSNRGENIYGSAISSPSFSPKPPFRSGSAKTKPKKTLSQDSEAMCPMSKLKNSLDMP